MRAPRRRHRRDRGPGTREPVATGLHRRPRAGGGVLQSPRTRKQSRPRVRTPTARAAGIPELQVIVDTRERYPYRFSTQRVRIVRRALRVGDYAVAYGGRLVPRVAVVVEDRYSHVFTQAHARPAAVADALAELQVRWPDVPIVFCESRSLAEEFTYRYLAAAHHWAADEPAASQRTGTAVAELPDAPSSPDPSTAEVRAWARAHGVPVPDRGRLCPEVWQALRDAHAPTE